MSINLQRSWEPTEWERHVLVLGRLRHGPAKFVRIPDQDRGDLGIEAYTTDGFAYQSYCPKEPLSLKELKQKINDKITTDTNKIRANQKKLKAILGTIKITRWCLVVPRHESKDCVAHAAKKRDEIRAAQLNCVDEDFEIFIHTEADFPAEIKALGEGLRLSLGLTNVGPPSANAIGVWSAQNSAFLSKAREKLEKAYPGNAAQQSNVLNSLVESYIEGENLLSTLKNEYPEVWEGIEKQKQALEKNLEFTSNLVPSSSPAKFAQLHEDYTEKLQNTYSSLDPRDVQSLSRQAIADWTFRCPLDF